MSEPLDDLRRMNDQDRLERDRGMLKSVHGALVDAGCTMGEIGECEADLVRQITKERDHYLKAVTGTIEQVEHQRKRAEQAEAKVALIMAQRDTGTLELLAENERHAATTAKVDELEARIKELDLAHCLLDQAVTDYRRSRDRAEAKVARLIAAGDGLRSQWLEDSRDPRCIAWGEAKK